MPNKIIQLLQANPLFEGLTENQLSALVAIAESVLVPPGLIILNEGDIGKEMYLVVKGKLEVVKKDEEFHALHQVAVVDQGEVVGEMALIDNSPRSASIRALVETTLLKLPFEKFSQLPESKEASSRLIVNLSKELSQRLRKTGSVAVRALQAELEGVKIRAEMGDYLFKFLIMLSGWIFFITMLKEYKKVVKIGSFITFPVILSLVFLCINVIKKSRYPSSYFGLTLKNWKHSFWESFIFTIPVLLFATLCKWLLIQYSQAYAGASLFRTSYIDPSLGVPAIIQIAIPFAYTLLVPLQELMARGTMQTIIRESLSVPHITFWSIFLSNLIFAAFHAELSTSFILAAFTGGCFWGWLYARQGSLVGPIVSHALIGAWCLFILGLDTILAG